MTEAPSIELKLEKVFENFNNPDIYFIKGITGCMEIAETASAILAEYKNITTPFCICTDDRSLVLAAVAASLCGGPQLILPHSFSVNALTEMKSIHNFEFVLTDIERELPAGVKPVFKIRSGSGKLTFNKNPHEIFLRLFTGGSTGSPKVWTKSVNNLFSEAFFLSRNFGITGDDVFLSSVPPYHIYGLLFSVLVPFVSGASVIQGTPLFPNEIIKYISDEKPSVLVSVPPHYRTLNGSGIKESSLRLAFSSAGSLNQDDASYFAEKTGIEINEVFGSTETGGIAAKKISDGAAYSVFYGVEYRISDERLLVKSDFISDDLPRNGDGFYLTGDRVELLDNGKFRLLGRADGIVKVGGKRVDLAEIQDKIKSISGVMDAVVLSIPVSGGRENEISAIVEGSVEEQGVRIHLMGSLEAYAVPKKIKIVEKIPVTSAGKYNKTELEKLL